MNILFFLLLSVTTLAVAQEEHNKPVVCGPLNKIIEELRSDYKESPHWRGVDEDPTTAYSLLTNPKTGSWTFIQYNQTTACILGSGQNSKFVVRAST